MVSADTPADKISMDSMATDSDDHPVDLAIRRCRQGDIGGLEVLYRLYGDRVFRTCFRILGQRQAAEDQTHEVFLRVFEKIRRFEGRSRFSTWLFRLTVNHTLNLKRSDRRRARRHIVLEVVPEPVSRHPGPERLTERTQARNLVQTLLSQLEPDHRAVLVLREIEEMSYDEIAAVLDIPRGTVMSRLHRARSRLKQCYLGRNRNEGSAVQR